MIALVLALGGLGESGGEFVMIKRRLPGSFVRIHQNEFASLAAKIVAIPEFGVRGEPMRNEAAFIDAALRLSGTASPRLGGVVGLRRRAGCGEGGDSQRGEDGQHSFCLHHGTVHSWIPADQPERIFTSRRSPVVSTGLNPILLYLSLSTPYVSDVSTGVH